MARRLAAGQRLEDEPVEKERPRIGRDGKPILGKDGKPLMRRRRNRRGSDDVKRDMLVEDVLKESKRECSPISIHICFRFFPAALSPPESAR